MPKFKEELSWLAIKVETLPPTLQAKHQIVRDLFAQVKAAKAEFEQEANKVLASIAEALPAAAKATLKVDANGKFPANSVLKYSYMRGVAVATASAPKAKASSGISLTA